MELIEVYNGTTKSEFLGHPTLPRKELSNSKADAIIVCLYDKKNPMSINYLPDDISQTDNMYWVFDNKVTKQKLTNSTKRSEIDNYNAKYNLWAGKSTVTSLPKMELPFKFSPQKFSNYKEMNDWKDNLIIKIADNGGVRWIT